MAKQIQRKKKFEGQTKRKKTIGKKVKKQIEKELSEKFKYLREVDRMKYKDALVAHYGRSFVDKKMIGTTTRKSQDQMLMRLFRQMEIEVENEEMEIGEYLEKIGAEFKTIGRPKSTLNWKEFEYLCSIGCTLKEIAGFFQMSDRTLQARVKEEYNETFSERWEKLSQGVKIAIRRKQIAVAMEGSESMLRFLGKNMLGQKDQVDFDGQVKVNSWVDLVNNIEKDMKGDDAIPGRI